MTYVYDLLRRSRSRSLRASSFLRMAYTSAIDSLEETWVYRKFAEMSKDKTAVINTHRLGSVRIADRIVVLDAGRIVETGTHEELMERKGHVKKQKRLKLRR